jgi:6-phosphofructokinase 1
LELCHNYGLREVLGIPFGYQGLGPAGMPLRSLVPASVEGIAEVGGSVLGSSRGSPETSVMVDFIERQGIDILLCVGGDGTQRGAYRLTEEIARRGLKVAVVGIPKTIDNDIQLCDQTFGFFTAADSAKQVITAAHVEARGARNGIALVKVMGRDSGFIAAAATLASGEVNFTLIPEQQFSLHGERGFLEVLKARILSRGHAVVVVAEGAGQHLFATDDARRDASGNLAYQDIGPYLKQEIVSFFAKESVPAEVKYIDPSYIIRSVPANAVDGVLCDQLARRAVHAAMAGKTGMLVASLNRAYVHVPIPLATAERRKLSLQSEAWMSVLAATGQPSRFE